MTFIRSNIFLGRGKPNAKLNFYFTDIFIFKGDKGKKMGNNNQAFCNYAGGTPIANDRSRTGSRKSSPSDRQSANFGRAKPNTMTHPMPRTPNTYNDPNTVRHTRPHLDDYNSCDEKHSIDKTETTNDMIKTIQSRIKSKVTEKSIRKIPLPKIPETISESGETYLQGALDANGQFIFKNQFPFSSSGKKTTGAMGPSLSISPDERNSTSSGLFRTSNDSVLKNTFIGTANFNSIHSEVSPNNLTIVSNKIREKYFSSRKSDILLTYSGTRDTSSKTIGGEHSGLRLSYSKFSNIEKHRKTSIDNLGKLAQIIDQSELREMTKILISEKQKELVDEIDGELESDETMINYKFKCLRQDLQAFYQEFDQICYEDTEIHFLHPEAILLPKNLKILLTGISINGLLEGYTKLIYAESGTKYYFGDFYRNQVHQKSAQTYHPNGQIEYQGDILFGQKSGYGKIFWPNGNLKVDGEFRHDQFHGRNVLFYHENKMLKFQGDFFEGKKENYGKWYNKGGILVCEGGIKGDKVDGKGVKWYYNSGEVKFEGCVGNGRKNGPGVVYYRNGRVRYEGLWEADRAVGGEGGVVRVFGEDGGVEYEGPVLEGYIMNLN